jgi:hypothetical protein
VAAAVRAVLERDETSTISHHYFISSIGAIKLGIGGELLKLKFEGQKIMLPLINTF